MYHKSNSDTRDAPVDQQMQINRILDRVISSVAKDHQTVKDSHSISGGNITNNWPLFNQSVLIVWRE